MNEHQSLFLTQSTLWKRRQWNEEPSSHTCSQFPGDVLKPEQDGGRASGALKRTWSAGGGVTHATAPRPAPRHR